MHISRADSDASERAPLISSPSGRGGSTSSAAGDALKASNSNATTTATSNGKGQQQQQQQQFANKNPRMGYAIGYLRKASGQVKTYLSLHLQLAYLKSKCSSYQTESGLPNASNTGTARSHEYQDIADEADSAPAAPPAAAEGVDDLVGGPLDLGPSLMDEVSQGCAFFSHATVSIGDKAVLLGICFIVLHKLITPPK